MEARTLVRGARPPALSAGEGLGRAKYSVGADNRGCLTLTDQLNNTLTLRFPLGGVTGGVATKGDITLCNEQSATPEYAAGILRLQDPDAFTMTALAPNYAFGADGWKNSTGALTHFAIAVTFAQSGADLSNAAMDANDEESSSLRARSP